MTRVAAWRNGLGGARFLMPFAQCVRYLTFYNVIIMYHVASSEILLMLAADRG